MFDFENTNTHPELDQIFRRASNAPSNMPKTIAYQGYLGTTNLCEFKIITANASCSKQECLAMSLPHFLKHYILN